MEYVEGKIFAWLSFMNNSKRIVYDCLPGKLLLVRGRGTSHSYLLVLLGKAVSQGVLSHDTLL